MKKVESAATSRRISRPIFVKCFVRCPPRKSHDSRVSWRHNSRAAAVSAEDPAPRSMSDEAYPTNVPKSAAETAWHERTMAVMQRTGADGTVLVRGTTTDPPHTEETMAGVRLMMITQERDDALKHAFAFVCCEDSDADSDDSNCARFYNTAAGNEVVFGIKDEVKKATSSKLTKPQKFDRLCMLTYALLQEDTWSRDNECWGDGDEMQSACKKLAASWKKLLGENAAADLGVDEEFTEPGVHALLEDFQVMLNDASSDSGVKYPFKWRA